MKNLILLISLLFTINLQAQQDPLVTHFWNNYSHFNPATSAIDYGSHAAVTYRHQWTGTYGGPRTIFANYNTYLGSSFAGGINYQYGRIGSIDRQSIQANVNWKIHLSRTNKIVIGVAPTFRHLTLGGIWITPTGSPDPIIENFKNQFFSLNSGIAYKSKALMAGVGITNLVNFYHKYTPQLLVNQTPQLYAHIRGKILLTRIHHLTLEGLFRSDYVTSGFEANVRWEYRNKIMVGVGFRQSDALIFNLGWKFQKQFQVGYSYGSNRVINELGGNSNGSHELSLSYIINSNTRRFQAPGNISF